MHCFSFQKEIMPTQLLVDKADLDCVAMEQDYWNHFSLLRYLTNALILFDNAIYQFQE